MKTVIVLLLLTTVTCLPVEAQLFGQQDKKAALMTEQIADLEIYLHQLNAGYNIATKGLERAHELKNETLGLHSNYFKSLQQVNPVITADPKGKAIYRLQQQLVTVFEAEVQWQKEANVLYRGEMEHLQRVYIHLLSECQGDLDELIEVLTPGKLELSDQQRMERLVLLYNRMKDKYTFAGYFTTQCRKLALHRLQIGGSNRQVQQLYDIN